MTVENRFTPEPLTSIPRGFMFVFGSNESGAHGAGAAAFAYDNCGAWYGQGVGPMNQCYAIPTKDWNVKTLPLDVVAMYISRFNAFTKMERKGAPKFYVTKIGCGLAGFKAEQIAPLFKDIRHQENVWLPEEFVKIIDALPDEEITEKIEELYAKDTSL